MMFLCCPLQHTSALVKDLHCVGRDGNTVSNMLVTGKHRVDVRSKLGAFVVVHRVSDVLIGTLDLNHLLARGGVAGTTLTQLGHNLLDTAIYSHRRTREEREENLISKTVDVELCQPSSSAVCSNVRGRWTDHAVPPSPFFFLFLEIQRACEYTDGGNKWSYLKELIYLHLAGSIDVNSLDGRANLVVGLTFTNLLNDLD